MPEYKIILDSGHGGEEDPGAVYQGRREKDDNLRLALAVGKILEDNGIDVVYTRTDDIYQTPFQKATIGNQSGADFFISFHRNSSPMPNQYSGVETLVYDKSGIKNEMAENIGGALGELGFTDLGVKERPGLVVLRRTSIPAVLIETGFLNTDSDNAKFDRQFDEIAEAIANAILGTLDLDTIESAETPEAEVRTMQPVANPDVTETPEPTRRPAPPATPCPPCPDRDDDTPKIYYRVQVAAYTEKEYADNLAYELQDKGFPAFVIYEGGYYKVQVGAFLNLGNAIRMEQRVREAGYTTWITT